MAYVQSAEQYNNSECFKDGESIKSMRRPAGTFTRFSYPTTSARTNCNERIHHATAEDRQPSVGSTSPYYQSNHASCARSTAFEDSRLPSLPISPKSSPGDGPIRRGTDRPSMSHMPSNIDIEQGLPHQQQTHGSRYLQPTVEEDPSPGSTSWASQETPRPTASQQNNQTNLSGKFASFRSSVIHQCTPNARDILNRQQELFEGLERVCTNAARAYWRSQCDSALDKLAIRSSRHRRRNQFQPYPTDRFRSQQQLSLADYLVRIAQKLWERATASNDHAAELEAVHRMGNLYAWGERIAMAARGEMAFGTQDGVFRIVMAARDLASWLLNEEAKREIDEIWQDRSLFGRLVLGGPM